MRGISSIAAAGAVPCPVIPGDEVRVRLAPKPHAYPTGRCPVANPGNLVGRTWRRSGTVPGRPARAARLRCDRVRGAGGPSTLSERHPEGSREWPLPARPSCRPGEGAVRDGEERCRRLTREGAADPDLPARPAGASPAAVAGARAG